MKSLSLRSAIAIASLLLASSQAARSQTIDAQCPAGTINSANQPDNTEVAQDACQKAIDLFKYLAPQLGAVLAGGNPTQGVSGTLGGLGHFSIGARANILYASLPQVDRVVPNTRGAQVSTYGIDDQIIGFATADVALGLLKGLAGSGFGSVDLLVSGSYLPSFSNANVDIAVPSGSLKFGLGAKVGLLSESSTRPGISVSYLDRGLPTVSITGKSGDDRLVLADLSVRSKSWRAVAGKSFLIFGIGGGFGQDRYDSKANISVTVAPRQATQGGTGGPIALSQQMTRNNLFGTAWLNLKLFRLVGELGRVTGGTIVTYNQFDAEYPADGPRTYGSVGISFGR
jgi:hypothetical protein